VTVQPPPSSEPQFAVENGTLLEHVGYHTCGAGGGETPHEPWCGWVSRGEVADLLAGADQALGDALMTHVTELTELVDHGPDGLGVDDNWRAGVAFALNRIVADLFLRRYLVPADPDWDHSTT
jgi:hypothetical protein